MINTHLSASSGVQAQELSGSASNGNSVLSGLSTTPASSLGRHSSHQPSMAEANAASHILRNARQHGGFISADAKARLASYQHRGAISQTQINSVSQDRGRLLGGSFWDRWSRWSRWSRSLSEFDDSNEDPNIQAHHHGRLLGESFSGRRSRLLSGFDGSATVQDKISECESLCAEANSICRRIDSSSRRAEISEKSQNLENAISRLRSNSRNGDPINHLLRRMEQAKGELEECLRRARRGGSFGPIGCLEPAN